MMNTIMNITMMKPPALLWNSGIFLYFTLMMPMLLIMMMMTMVKTMAMTMTMTTLIMKLNQQGTEDDACETAKQNFDSCNDQ